MAGNVQQELEAYWEKHPEHRHRKFRKIVIEALSGIEYDTYIKADTINRYFRALPQDGGEHARQTEYMDKIGYAAQSVHDGADGRLFSTNQHAL